MSVVFSVYETKYYYNYTEEQEIMTVKDVLSGYLKATLRYLNVNTFKHEP